MAYSQALRAFTKILKQPFGFLRRLGHSSVIYVNDSYLQGNTISSCLQNVKETITLLQKLGFTHTPRKIYPGPNPI